MRASCARRLCARSFAATTATATATRTWSSSLVHDESSFLDAASRVPDVTISVNEYDLEAHSVGEAWARPPTTRPFAVLSPSTTEAVVEVVRICAETRVPVIPFGAGTSLEGHVTPVRGGVSVDMSRMNSVRTPGESDDVSDEDLFAVVGAGATRNTLNEHLRHTGLQFMVDPGADASIGGMVATGASGTTAVKYGTMRENILAMEVVLPDGTVATCGTRALKSSAGYDLVGLMCGSEGTLGIVTSVTVKLHPVPAHKSVAVCSFPSLHNGADAVAAIVRSGLSPTRCELLDAVSVEAFNGYAAASRSATTQRLPARPHLFLEFAGATPSSVEEDARLAGALCAEDFEAADDVRVSVDEEEESRRLWAARHELYYASLALRPGASRSLTTDVCVPLSELANVMEATAADVEERSVVGPCFGHAGDGNFHCVMPLLDDETDDYRERVEAVNRNVIARAIAVGGTCTGEHGVGIGKKKYLPEQYGSGSVEMMRSIKKAIDPLNIMNPGKIV